MLSDALVNSVSEDQFEVFRLAWRGRVVRKGRHGRNHDRCALWNPGFVPLALSDHSILTGISPLTRRQGRIPPTGFPQQVAHLDAVITGSGRMMCGPCHRTVAENFLKHVGRAKSVGRYEAHHEAQNNGSDFLPGQTKVRLAFPEPDQTLHQGKPCEGLLISGRRIRDLNTSLVYGDIDDP